MELVKQSGFLYAEPLATGTLQAMISYPLGFDSKLPAKFGLPPLGKPNVAEGIVVKPVKDIVLESKKGPKRVIFKRKVEGFAEVKPRGRDHRVANGYKKQAEGATWTPDSDGQDFELLRYEMLALITTQRVVNVVSKLGRPSVSDTSHSPAKLGQKSSSSPDSLTESVVAMTVSAEKKAVVVESGVKWKDIVRGLVKDVIEELESEHLELWSACQRDGKRTGKLMQEMRKECAQCVEDYKISLSE